MSHYTIFNDNLEIHTFQKPYLNFLCTGTVKRDKLLWIFTCTALELMTATGVTAYLLYLGQTTIAIISGIVFAKVIGLHVIIEIRERLKLKKLLLKS